MGYKWSSYTFLILRIVYIAVNTYEVKQSSTAIYKAKIPVLHGLGIRRLYTIVFMIVPIYSRRCFFPTIITQVMLSFTILILDVYIKVNFSQILKAISVFSHLVSSCGLKRKHVCFKTQPYILNISSL